MKKILLLLTVIIMSGFCTACGSSSSKNSEPVQVIEDAERFSRINVEELKSLMGDPVSEDSWINKTSKGDFEVITLSYDKDSNHYEFIIADDSVVRLSIYSNNYYNREGDRFSYIGEKSDICKSFNITLGKNAKKVADTGFAYKLSPVNDKVAIFDIQDIDGDTYGFVKITYNLNYFD